MMDFVLEAWVSGIIETKKLQWMMGKREPWRPGEKLKLLFAGYNGTRNTGSDVRVEEMLRQIRWILGPENVDLTMMTFNFDRSRGYFVGTSQVRLPDIFPPFLANEVPKHHGVVACEGSMFKSKFANALATMMIGSLGIAAAENKLSVGYGAEAGHMDPVVAKMCGRYCRNSLVITRNDESRKILRGLGVPTELGTDTAWTFEPLGAEYGRNALRDVGWDGNTPVLVVCPINPFEWPVKASVAKAALHSLTGAYKESHYRGPYFHNSGPEADRAYEHYLSSIAKAVAAFQSRPRADVIYGHCYIVDREGRVIRRSRSVPFNLRLYAYGGVVVMQQSTFFRRQAFENVGGFNETNRTSWDAELLMDMALKGSRLDMVDDYWSVYAIYPGSITATVKYNQQYEADRARMFRTITGRDQERTNKIFFILARIEKLLRNPLVPLHRIIDKTSARTRLPRGWAGILPRPGPEPGA